ncbi:MAG: hypothetical protein HZA31_08455 [Opitutae bacterium]|nr:hypothetical protein [Opitutae bacterium]
MINSSPVFAAAHGALTWERQADLPDPVGLKGMYAGVSQGWVILAGGSNFPVPRQQGGVKTYAREILVRRAEAPADAPWKRVAPGLPEGLAEGASVTTEHGVVIVGGCDARGPVNTVALLRWDESAGNVQRLPLPALPRALTSVAAAYCRGLLYVAGGDNGAGGTKDFFALNLAAALAGGAAGAWRDLTTWSGPARFGAALAALGPVGRERLFLFGGKIGSSSPAGQANYLADGHVFDPETAQWSTVAAMPRQALLAAVLPLTASTLAVCGGSDGHDLARMAELGERYRLPDGIMIYHADTDRWEHAGQMPLGVAGAATVTLADRWLVIGGEPTPGLRTAQVQAARLVAAKAESSP